MKMSGHRTKELKRVNFNIVRNKRKTAVETTRSLMNFGIVGIGFSSGGIQSCFKLIEEVPNKTGLAFILCQHIKENIEEVTSSILSPFTGMVVVTAKTGMSIQPDQIYIVPANVNMSMINGSFQLESETYEKIQPIDYFFRSLAFDQSRLSIGVILSGSVVDGAQGLRSISSQGGLTLVQDPLSSEIKTMGLAAIAAGGSDKMLSVEEIAKELICISRHINDQLSEYQSGISPEITAKICRIVKQQTNADFSFYKPGLIVRRIKRRILLQLIESAEKYVEFLQHSPSEVDILFGDFLINVSCFFRDKDAFEYLKMNVFPRMLSQHDPQKDFRMWIAGCATGEEAYSFAIVVAEVAESLQLTVKVRIFASDLSSDSLSRARVAIFSDAIVDDVSPERLRKFFTRVPDGYQINTSLRAQCIFSNHNLGQDPPFSKMDFVSCRNLLNYFGSKKQESSVNLLAYSLKTNGFLMLGSTEEVRRSKYFKTVSKKHRVYQRRENISRSHFEIVSNETAFNRLVPAKLSRAAFTKAPEIFEQSVRQLLEQHYVPAGLVVDSNMQILQFRGATGEYLEPTPGDATLDVFRMAREGISRQLKILMREAKKSWEPKRKENVSYRSNNSEQVISLEVLPFVSVNGSKCYLVMFDDKIRSQDFKLSNTITVNQSNEISELQAELNSTCDYLQSIIREQDLSNEEQQSANEEILSSNEELRSYQEELEIAKEELQATNEQLTTLNDELSVRNRELHTENGDLIDFQESVGFPIVIVDKKLCIRNSTPSAGIVLGLLRTDIGRSIADFYFQVSNSHLESTLKDVIDLDQVRIIKFVTREQSELQLRICPYRSNDGFVTGAVLVFLDATLASSVT